MKLVPHGSISHGRGWMNTCGQACVAMIAELSLEKACEAVGTRGATTYRHMKEALEKLGFPCGPRVKLEENCGIDPALTALVRVKHQDRHSHMDHWAVWHGLLIYDSCFSEPMSWETYLSQGFRVTSFMEVTMPMRGATAKQGRIIQFIQRNLGIKWDPARQSAWRFIQENKAKAEEKYRSQHANCLLPKNPQTRPEDWGIPNH